MAQVYRAGQKEIGHLALAELAQQTSTLLHSAASARSSSDGAPASASAAPAIQHGDESCPAIREHEGGAPWRWGVELLCDRVVGQRLACVPHAAGAAAGSRAALVSLLAAARLRRGYSSFSAARLDRERPAPGIAAAQQQEDHRAGLVGGEHASHAGVGDQSGSLDAACCRVDVELLDGLIRHVDVPFAQSVLCGDAASLLAAEALSGEKPPGHASLLRLRLVFSRTQGYMACKI